MTEEYTPTNWRELEKWGLIRFPDRGPSSQLFVVDPETWNPICNVWGGTWDEREDNGKLIMEALAQFTHNCRGKENEQA